MSLSMWEFKTTSQDITPGSIYWRRVTSIDLQVTVYLAGLKATGFDCRNVIYDVLRLPAHRPSSKGETPEHFQERIVQVISEDPDKFFQRGRPVRLESDHTESNYDMWHTAEQIREGRRLNVWPRNFDACLHFNRECEFINVCCSEADIGDPFLFRKTGRFHSELSAANDTSDVLTQSSLRTYRACPRKFFFLYIMGVRRLRIAEPLRRGVTLHEALGEWMRTGGDLRAALRKLEVYDPYENAKHRALLIGYHARWDRPPKVLDIEREWSCKLVNPKTGAASRSFRLAGKADAVVELDDEEAAAQLEPSLAGRLEESISCIGGKG